MSYVISEPCIIASLCAQCLGVDNCPTEALQWGNGYAFIDAELCIDCGACIAACPHAVVRTTEPIFAQGHWKPMVETRQRYVVDRNWAMARLAARRN